MRSNSLGARGNRVHDAVLAHFEGINTLRSLSEDQRRHFARFAQAVHVIGFDWYVADGDPCWGIRQPGSTKALHRGGRLTIVGAKPVITFNAGPKRAEKLLVSTDELLEYGGELVGQRFELDLESASRLAQSGEVLHQIIEWAGLEPPKTVGGWPDDTEQDTDSVTRVRVGPRNWDPADDLPPRPGEDQKAYMKRRKGHDRFVRVVLEHWNGRCAVFGIEGKQYLTASHITPWRDATGEEKVSVHNGLLLSKPLDHLFDRGYIGFADDGTLILAKELQEEESEVLRVFGVDRPGLRLCADKLTKPMRDHLREHRKRYGMESPATRAQGHAG